MTRKRVAAIEADLLFCVPVTTLTFQARARREGKQAQLHAGQILQGAGFSIVQRNHTAEASRRRGELHRSDRQGAEWYFDVSGTFTSKATG